MKIKHVESYLKKQGKIIDVCRGKIIVVPRELEEFKSQYDSILKTYIVSESEKIEDGDMVYDTERKKIYEFKRDENTNEGYVTFCLNKVIVTHDQIPQKTLTALQENKIRDNDEVLVECYRRGKNTEGVDADLTGGIIIYKDDYYCIRLNEDKNANIIRIVGTGQKEVPYSLFQKIYNLGFSNGTMQESGLERNECEENFKSLQIKGELKIS